MLLAIVAAGVALRAACFVGWGLGDDAYYAYTAVSLWRGQFHLQFGSNYRLGLHLPNALALKLLGVNDLGFVLYPLLCSVATIPVSYLLGERLAGARAGLLAAALVATSPFDVVYSTTMTIDVITSFLCAAAVLLLLRSESARPPGAAWQQVLAALLLLQAYFVKIPALLFVGAIALYTASVRRLWRRHAIFYAALAALLGLSLLADLAVTGHALGYWTAERKTAPRLDPALGLASHLGFYPQAMFGALPDGSWPFGFTFYAVAAALLYSSVRRLPGRRLLVTWLLGLFLLLDLLPNRLGLPYLPLPRFTRYLHALVIPGLLLVAIAFDDLLRRHAKAGAVGFAAMLCGALLAQQRSAAVQRDAQRDVSEASRLLLSLPPADVYTDNRMLDRLNFDSGYSGSFGLRWMQQQIEEQRGPELLASLGRGYVVTGGARAGVWGGAVFDLGGLRPPPEWRLLHTLAGERRPWRREPLRIFAIER